MLVAIDTVHDLAATARGRRRSLGITQGQLAAQMSVSRQSVSLFESGKRTPQLSFVLRLLDALDMRLRVDTEPADERQASAAHPTIDLDRLLADYRTRDV